MGLPTTENATKFGRHGLETEKTKKNPEPKTAQPH